LRQNPVLKDLENGIKLGFLSINLEFSFDLIEYHKLVTLNFSIAIEREIMEIEDDSSTNLFSEYATDFYLKENPELVHQTSLELSKYLSGLGTRFMAVSQNNFQLQIIEVEQQE
jgi:hypothetical protein